MEQEKQVNLRETVGIFPDEGHMYAAIDELQQRHFPRQDISVQSNKSNNMKDLYRMGVEVGDMRGVPIMPEERSLLYAALIGGGVFAGTLLLGIPLMQADGPTQANILPYFVIGGAAGLVLGFALVAVVQQIERAWRKQQLRNGGFLLWVNTDTRAKERLACRIFSRHGGRNVHVQDMTLTA